MGIVCGVDEVGRGALCGPVVTAAVIFPPSAEAQALRNRVRDSKTLSRRQRAALDVEIRHLCRFAVGAASARAIDALNIRQATLLAMRRAVARIGLLPPDAEIVIDGVDICDRDPRMRAQIKADADVPEVAAASIVAKCFRDRLMVRLASRYPQYGWAKNAGYGAVAHRDGLAAHGATRHHRRSFSLPGLNEQRSSAA